MERTLKLLDSCANERAINDEICEAICRDALENVDADLVSIWRFDEAQSKIVCLHSCDLNNSKSMHGVELHRKDFPTYFQSIIEETVINAQDVHSHPMTRELGEAYFKPNKITSLLDFVVQHNYTPVGVICCESKQRQRIWNEQDIDYLRSLAACASFHTRF